MNLVGLDVGFSATRRSSGVARFADGEIRLGRATAAWSHRVEILGHSGKADVAAVDAPIAPEACSGPRSCEKLFTLGLFQRRCKPGLSHVPGTGQQLREAGFATAMQLAATAPKCELVARFPRVLARSNIVEAFPNAFLGVVVDAAHYEAIPRLRRGKKFDWLYDQWLDRNTFEHFTTGVDEGGALLEVLQDCVDHDERAALVCLLTAGEVAQGRYTAIGDHEGGYFYLPRLSSWSPWARIELQKQRRRIKSLEIWVDGTLLRDQ